MSISLSSKNTRVEDIEFFEVANALGLRTPILQNSVGYELCLTSWGRNMDNAGIYSSKLGARIALHNWVVAGLLDGAGIWDPAFEDENYLKKYISSHSEDTIISDYFTNWEEDEFEIKEVSIVDDSTLEFFGFSEKDDVFLPQLFATHYGHLGSGVYEKYERLMDSTEQNPITPGTTVYAVDIVLDSGYEHTIGYTAFRESAVRLLRNWVVREINNYAVDLNDDEIIPENDLFRDFGDLGIVDYYFKEMSSDSFSINEAVVLGTPNLLQA